MKNLLTLLFLLPVCHFSQAQEYHLVDEKKQELIASIANPITLASKKDCNRFYLTTTNGSIEKGGRDCQYVLFPVESGVATIRVHHKSGKVVEEKQYRVKEIELQIYLPGYEDIITDVEKFSKTARFELRSDDLVCWSIAFQMNYELIIVEQDQSSYRIQSDQAPFSDAVRAKFASLKPGSLLLFHNIKVIIDGKEYKVPDLTFDIL